MVTPRKLPTGEELSGVISAFEAHLKAIKPYVSTWHKIAGRGDENGGYWHRDIGYAKVDKRWGIALRTVDGHEAAEYDRTEVWLFKDAPLWIQIESIGKIPDLFDELIKRTKDAAQTLRKKTIEARVMADALANVVNEMNGKKP